jgi:hypothetical protein
MMNVFYTAEGKNERTYCTMYAVRAMNRLSKFLRNLDVVYRKSEGSIHLPEFTAFAGVGIVTKVKM